MECLTFVQSVDAYLEDRLDRSRREAFREHLRSCERCRAEALAVDPSLMLIAGKAKVTDEEAVADCVEAVAGLVRQEKIRRSLRPSHRSWWAAAAVLVLTLGGSWLWWPAPGGDMSSPVAVSDGTAGSGEGAAPPPHVEVQMPDGDVRVYQYATSQDETTAVYFVVNEAMEL